MVTTRYVHIVPFTYHDKKRIHILPKFYQGGLQHERKVSNTKYTRSTDRIDFELEMSFVEEEV